MANRELEREGTKGSIIVLLEYKNIYVTKSIILKGIEI